MCIIRTQDKSIISPDVNLLASRHGQDPDNKTYRD
jgi:hypothetical protein